MYLEQKTGASIVRVPYSITSKSSPLPKHTAF